MVAKLFLFFSCKLGEIIRIRMMKKMDQRADLNLKEESKGLFWTGGNEKLGFIGT